MFTRNQLLSEFPTGNPFPDGRRYDPVTAMIGSAAVGAGGSILGGLFGSNAADKAAKQQVAAANAAAQGVTDATNLVNPTISAAAKAAGAGVTDAATAAAGGVTAAAGKANALLDPYAATGANATNLINAGLAEGGAFNKTPQLSDLTVDPGYAFREQQGEKALSQGAAARGAVEGGGFAKDINAFAQSNASQEYQNAFARFEQSTQNRFANLSSAAGAGQAAATTEGGNTIGAARYGGDIGFAGQEYAGSLNSNAANLIAANTIGAAQTAGNYKTQAGNAQAAGTVGSSNAWNTAFGGAANAVTGAAQFNSLLNNPNYINRPDINTPTFNPAGNGSWIYPTRTP